MGNNYIVNIEAEELFIRKEYEALIEDYINSNHSRKLDIIDRAYKFSYEAHKEMRRRSGEPYIIHPIAVARIVVKEIGLGSTSICAALLHDVVEDTEYTVEDIEKNFGAKIAQIVGGLTKISGGVFGENASAQAENYRKLLLTMSDDLRVVLIKLADRLHNMRTLDSMPPQKQYKIAGETEYIYAPLAHRLGLFKIKTELENLSFKYEHPADYRSIEEQLNEKVVGIDKFYEEFSEPISNKLKEEGYSFEVQKRIKSVYSISKKMSNRNIPFDEVYDILAVRVIFEPKEGLDEKSQCWLVYSAITAIYKPHPERIRDWVSTPKANGYEALHVTVMTPIGRWVEIQIRTKRMDEIAEKGLAAHWKYKHADQADTELDKWLKAAKELLENPETNAMDFMSTFKMSLYAIDIVVFTPKGDIKTIAKGATVLDFAFLLHSKIGYHSLAAKVNHKLVSIDYVLNSGDQVEIVTSDKQEPKREWLEFIVTAQAKSKLEYYFRKQDKKLIKKGEKIVQDEFVANDILFENRNLTKVLSHFNIEKWNDLFLQVGQGAITVEDVLKVFKTKKIESSSGMLSKILRNPFSSSNNKPDVSSKPDEKTEKFNFKKTYKLNELNLGKAYEISKCCNPIPGDDVLGYLDDNNIIQVHKRQCNYANIIKSNFGNRIVNVEWGVQKSVSFIEKIEIKGIDKIGILIEILEVISKNSNINVKEIGIKSNNGIFIGELGIVVHSTEDINNLIHNLVKIPEVTSVARVQTQ